MLDLHAGLSSSGSPLIHLAKGANVLYTNMVRLQMQTPPREGSQTSIINAARPHNDDIEPIWPSLRKGSAKKELIPPQSEAKAELLKHQALHLSVFEANCDLQSSWPLWAILDWQNLCLQTIHFVSRPRMQKIVGYHMAKLRTMM